ncbi:ABC transporter permease [Glycomyces sp. YM15]|uniref:ABC transporter permease n=1 Tax=Glycomyces sp. YM15 TaxID=2800446 RepID=UPI0019665F5E|nr:ABC transporter permease [Glycomyces sp. YM15]
MASQRLAFRIARREALRYKGRSVLSITLLGLPLLGVAIGASAYDTATLSPEETAIQYLGENDAYISADNPGEPLTQFTWDSQYPWWESEMTEDDGEPGTITEMGVLAELPLGSRITPYSFWNGSEQRAQVETPDGIGDIDVLGYDLTDPNYEAAGFTYLDGSAPIRDEVVLSEDAASYLEVGVGDSITMVHGGADEEFEVSGIIEIPWDINGRYAIASFFPTEASGWLVDTPEPFTYEDALALNEAGMTVWATSLIDRPSTIPAEYGYSVTYFDEATLTLYVLLVVVVVMEVILLAGPAFAISARRRTREFALMSATGATPKQIRTIVLAGGVLFGVIAAVVAVLLGIGVVAAGRPLLEQIVGYRTPGLQVLPWLQGVLVAAAIVTGLLSALAAAISASRINVVAALMGRTPGRKGSKLWLLIGLVMVGGGMVAGFAGITIWSMPLMAGAIVLLQLGLVACTPALLALTAKLGRWMPLAPRMALREAGRNRGSAAPAIAAVLGVVAGGMAFSMTIAANNVRGEALKEHLLPQGALTLTMWNDSEDYDPETGMPIGDPAWEEGLAESEARLGKHLDELEITKIQISETDATCGREDVDPENSYCSVAMTRPAENRCSFWETETHTEEQMLAAVAAAREDPNCNETGDGYGFYEVPTSADPDVVAAYSELEGDELDAAVALLEDGGVLISDALSLTDEGTVVFEQRIESWDEETGEETESEATEIELPAIVVDENLLGYSKVLLSPGAAERLGMTESLWSRQYLVSTSTVVDSAVREAISSDLNAEIADGDISANFRVTDYTDLTSFYMMLAVAGLCALITLGSTAVSTGLIIAEQRKDMTTLGAVGAAPGLRKRFAMWQTIMIALFGSALGTVAGVIGYALIRQALNRSLMNQYPFQVLYTWELPWTSFAIMVVAVPVLAAIGALLFTKARLPSERRLT